MSTRLAGRLKGRHGGDLTDRLNHLLPHDKAAAAAGAARINADQTLPDWFKQMAASLADT